MLSTQDGAIDFGWRLGGQPVGVLRDRSLVLPRPATGPVSSLLRFFPDPEALTACLQCGICTASCDLAEPQGRFPRRQMNLLQTGTVESLLADPAIWECYGCLDCSRNCPAEALPGRVLAAARQASVEYFAFPSVLGRIMNEPRFAWGLFFIPAVLLAAAIALWGSFTPPLHPVRYAAMFPHLALNLFYFGFTAFAAAGMLVSAWRAWRAFRGEDPRPATKRSLLGAAAAAFSEILSHRRFSGCAESPFRRIAHGGLLFGFLVLSGLAGVAALMILFGLPYPFPPAHPLKIAGNTAGSGVMGGALFFLISRLRSRQNGSVYADWLLLAQILFATVTGFMAEIFRYRDVAAAYPIYFLHHIAVFGLLVFLPYSKLAHAGLRLVALTATQLNETPSPSAAVKLPLRKTA